MRKDVTCHASTYAFKLATILACQATRIIIVKSWENSSTLLTFGSNLKHVKDELKRYEHVKLFGFSRSFTIYFTLNTPDDLLAKLCTTDAVSSITFCQSAVIIIIYFT